MEDTSEVHSVLRGLMDVAKVALGQGSAEIPEDEAIELLIRLIAVVDREMPPEMQKRDPRMIKARGLFNAMRQ